MLDQSTRAAILRLHQQGDGSRKIAKALHISREAVKDVIESGTQQVPIIQRQELCTPYRDQSVELVQDCRGNLVRVHEELQEQGASVSYQALTAFCRRNEIGHPPSKPAGHYHFKPGQEMQHDTSPHRVTIGGKERLVQTASLVLCFSRMLFFQMYPRFRRFECKGFLTEALLYFAGACGICGIDNTHVVVLSGTGANMVPVPEMASFAERFGFKWKAHELGDANRSARVEGHFKYIEGNFLAKRTFRDWKHLNEEARKWCDKVNAIHSPKLHASRRELFAIEQPYLLGLPAWIPEVYRLHQRIVDSEGYINLDSNRYSVPYQLIGRPLEVRELRDLLDIYQGHRLVASHERPEEGPVRVTCQEHRPPRGQGPKRTDPCPEEKELVAMEPQLVPFVEALKSHDKGRAMLTLRKLLCIVRDYPRESVLFAAQRALSFGLYDMTRLERMVLRHIADDFFVVCPEQSLEDKEDDDDR